MSAVIAASVAASSSSPYPLEQLAGWERERGEEMRRVNKSEQERHGPGRGRFLCACAAAGYFHASACWLVGSSLLDPVLRPFGAFGPLDILAVAGVHHAWVMHDPADSVWGEASPGRPGLHACSHLAN